MKRIAVSFSFLYFAKTSMWTGVQICEITYASLLNLEIIALTF